MCPFQDFYSTEDTKIIKRQVTNWEEIAKYTLLKAFYQK
jgi:hypothetical protein